MINDRTYDHESRWCPYKHMMKIEVRYRGTGQLGDATRFKTLLAIMVSTQLQKMDLLNIPGVVMGPDGYPINGANCPGGNV